jgi:hypothetical protein
MVGSIMDDLGVVRWLRDRAQITDLIIRFANALDRQDWPRLRACLTPELDIDYSDLRGDPPGRVTADDFVAARVRGLAGLRTQHVSTNFEITVEGDRAECFSSFLIHRLDPAGPPDANTFDTAGHYHHGLRRTPEGWRIDRIEQRVLWSRGEPRVHGALRGPER